MEVITLFFQVKDFEKAGFCFRNTLYKGRRNLMRAPR